MIFAIATNNELLTHALSSDGFPSGSNLSVISVEKLERGNFRLSFSYHRSDYGSCSFLPKPAEMQGL